MRGYYITNLNTNETSGVSKKIEMQIKALQDLGCEISLLSYFKRYKFRKIKALTTRLPFFPLSSRWNYIPDLQNVDFIYIRYPLADKWFINFLRRIKDIKPSLKIFVEIATYPYDGEAKSLSKRMRFLKDRTHRVRMKKYVDYIVTSSKFNSIFDIPTIKIINGIDISSVPLSEKINESNVITFGIVSSLSFWQGFDRLIEGMHSYYMEGNKDVRLIIVGDGGEREKLFKLSNNKGLIDNGMIEFKGEVYGEKLNHIFNDIDVGIGCIGLHRKGMDFVNTLKVREYCARGIPFVIANEEGGIDDSLPFVLRIPANDSPVDIYEVVKFYQGVVEMPNIKNEIRSYATNNLSWKAQMRKILTKINNF